ncbi:MAG: DDE-type integrase/transposase/recombinase [Candidatus Thiodiazotropha sp. (ex Ctena orbiculata)]|uniref:DDE-type integrase/transposase/recombinase n=1 Tax=Candidatus Thiodiazotropha taylori TaxID=2792791 RepID=A0A944M767_9GAMM|nr:DDE-type integrase/transposase/recombinase [Candidatus Thiodiazotropha taylori]
MPRAPCARISRRDPYPQERARKYRHTAKDDYTRVRVLRLYWRRTASNTFNFIDAVIEEAEFPVRRIPTDQGSVFLTTKVQKRLMEYGIKY